jgi:hypothetical protein
MFRIVKIFWGVMDSKDIYVTCEGVEKLGKMNVWVRIPLGVNKQINTEERQGKYKRKTKWDTNE